MRLVLQRARQEEGASAVEFALVSIILVLFLTAIVQFGFTFFQYLEVVHGAREGARWASLSTPAGSVGAADTVRYRVAQAAPGLTPGLDDSNISVSVDGTGNEDATYPADTGKPVTVTVTYESPVFMPLIGEIVGEAFTLTSAATLRVE
ncbi:MAG: TadE/TadG family type IV pilus assembly protein [Actinomycetota bacterium]|jgi:Flp pilus assembly protein TadG|nr:TadE/TadG family type IV pilus assembly protein [Actinomycetota bacterium]